LNCGSGKIPIAAANTKSGADAGRAKMRERVAYLPWLLHAAAGKMAQHMVLRQNTLK
jgi:hypothetical protein